MRKPVLLIVKAFDKVWNEGPLHKLKGYGIAWQMFLTDSLLSIREMNVVLYWSFKNDLC